MLVKLKPDFQSIGFRLICISLSRVTRDLQPSDFRVKDRKLHTVNQHLDLFLHVCVCVCVCVCAQSVLSEPLQPMDCSPPGASVHGILQTRILEWVGRLLLQESFLIQRLDLLHWQTDSLPLCHLGSP